MKIYVDIYEEKSKENNFYEYNNKFIKIKKCKTISKTIQKINKKLNKEIKKVKGKETIKIIPSTNTIKIVKENQYFNKNVKENWQTKIIKLFDYKKKINYIENTILENINNKEIYFEFIIDIMNNIIKIKQEQAKEQCIYVLINNDININFLEDLKKQYKMVYIVTKNIEKFRKIEENAEENLDMIAVLNNKRKSLTRAKYIINFDFDQNEINQYSINRTAILLNLYKQNINFKKGFDGIIINNIQLNNKEKYPIEYYYKEERKEVKKYIKNMQYDLIGQNGKINIKEIQN